MRNRLYLPVVENSEGPSDEKARREFSIGERVFPGEKNATGKLLDRLGR